MSPGPRRNPYEVLGVKPDATMAQIRVAWRRVAKTAHPDAGGNADAFRQLQQAFNLLGDPQRRALFDREHAMGSGVAGAPGPDRDADPDVSPSTQSSVASHGAAADRVRRRWVGAAGIWQLPGTAMSTRLTGPSVVIAAPAVLTVGSTAAGPNVVTAWSITTGASRWLARFAAPAQVAVATTTAVVVATADAVVHGLATDTGVTLWERPVTAPVTCVAGFGVGGGVAGAADPTVFVASGEFVTAVGGGGLTRWSVRLGHEPVWMVCATAVLVVATKGGTVVALDLRTGRTRWWVRHRVDAALVAVEVAGLVWVADGRQHLVGLDCTSGAAAHMVDMGEPVTGMYTVADRLAVTTGSDALVLLGPTGIPRWKAHFSAPFSPPAMADGVVVVAVADGSVRLLSERTGAELHHVVADFGPVHIPAQLVMDDPVMVVAGDDGTAVGLQRIG